jgi:hypothetical protein
MGALDVDEMIVQLLIAEGFETLECRRYAHF